MAFSKCQKFTANIYDKNRCKNCYKPKELHSEAALQSNKESRKISKCGYLFVAPDSFDFSGPLDKTRRWQRRFFVLYDDGELTYSVDENINTVPQGIIDMNKCGDVVDAENITTHSHSIAVVTPEKTTYIKGAGKEETSRWHDVLVMYPRSAKSRHKRSPTFPSKSTSSLNGLLEKSQVKSSTDTAMSGDINLAKRQRYHSVASTTAASIAPSKENISGFVSSGSSQKGTDALTRLGFMSHVSSMAPVTSSSATAPSRSADQHQPLTYRGVRSLKHRHDKSYSEGLRKSNSLHDLPSTGAGDVDVLLGASSRSRESLIHVGQSVSDRCAMLDSGTVSVYDMDSNKPKTFFEFLKTEPTKPQGKNSRYMRLAGIPHVRTIEDYTPWKAGNPERTHRRRKSVPTTELERMEANHVVAATTKFWESQAFDSIQISGKDIKHCDQGQCDNLHEGIGQYTCTSMANYGKTVGSVAITKIPCNNPPVPTRTHSLINHNRPSLHVITANRPASSNHINSPQVHHANPSQHLTSTQTATGQTDSTSTVITQIHSLHSSVPSYHVRSRYNPKPAVSQEENCGEPAGVGWRSRSSSSSNPEPNNSIFRSRSPTSSLLLNGRSKNETDERKMAKSDLSSGNVSGDGRLMDNSSTITTTDSVNAFPPHEDLQYMKKGWLVKQGNTDKDWKKCWFVLSGSTLKYYEDMEGEKTGAALGCINLAVCYDLSEVAVSRKYGFKLKTRAGDYTLSALTSGIRKNWMQAIGHCIQTTGSSGSSQSICLPTDGSSQASRRGAERYHTHSGAFIHSETISPSHVNSVCAEPPPGPSPRENGSSIPKKPERNSMPQRYRRAASDELVLASSVEVPRLRSRRRTTDNVSKIPEPSFGKTSKISCTWPYSSSDNGLSEATSLQSLKSSQDSGSQRDLSQYLNENEKTCELSQQEEEELDNVQRNIRRIHRKSITELVQQHKPRHFDKFETGSAFIGSPERDPSLEQLARSRSRDSSKSPSHSRESSSSNLSPRTRTYSFDKTSDFSEGNRSPSTRRAPSAKIKEKSRTKSPRSKSPPPLSLDIDEQDIQRGLDFSGLDLNLNQQSSSSDITNSRLRDQVDTRSTSDSNSGNGGDALVDLLETQVESLKIQLERTRSQLAETQKINSDLKMQMRTTKKDHSEYLDDVEMDQSRFLAQIEDYQQEIDKTSIMYKSRLTDQENKNKLQLQKLQSQLKDAEQTIHTKNNEIKSLQSKIQISASELSKLQAALEQSAHELRVEQGSSSKTIQDLDLRVEQLEKELNDSHLMLCRKEQDIITKQDLLQRMEKEVNLKADKVGDLKDQVDGLICLKEEVEEKTNMAEAMKQEAQLLRQQLREQDEKLQKSQRDAAEKVRTIEGEFYREKEHLENRVEILQQQIERFSKQSNMADSLNSSMADILKEKDETISQLEEKLIESEGKIEEFSEELSTEVEENSNQQTKIQDLNRQNNDLYAKVAQLEAQVTDMDSAYRELESETSQKDKQLSEHQAEKQLLTNDLLSVESKVKQLEKEIKQSTERLKVTNEELKMARSAIADNEAGNFTIMSDFVQLKDTYANKCVELEKSKTELNQYSEKYDLFRQEMENFQRDYKDSVDELNEVRGEYKSTLKDLQESTEHITNLESQIDNLVQEQTNELESKEKELSAAKSQLDIYKIKFEQTTKNLQNVEVSKDLLSKQLQVQYEDFQNEMEAKYHELTENQKLIDKLREQLKENQSSIEKESQLSVNMSPLHPSNVNDTSFYSDIPKSYEELRTVYKKLVSEHRDMKRTWKETTVKCEDAESNTKSLKDQLRALEQNHREEVEQLNSKLSELTNQLSGLERRNKRLERRTKSQEIYPQVDSEVQTDFKEYETSSYQEDMGVEKFQELQNELDKSDAKVNELMNRLMQQHSFEVELDLLHQQLVTLENENRQIRDRIGSGEEDSEKDRHLAGKLRELQLKMRQCISLMEECSDKLSGAIVDIDDPELQDFDSQFSYSAKYKIQSALVTLRDAKALLPHKKVISQSTVSDDVKLRLFSERLALEAVILGEMSYLVRSGETSNNQSLKDMQAAKGKVLEIATLLTKQYCKDDSLECMPTEEDSLSTYASLLSQKFRIQTELLFAMDEAKPLQSNHIDVFVTDNKDLQEVALKSLSQSCLSLMLSGSSLDATPAAGIVSASCHAVTRADLSYLLDMLKDNMMKDDSSHKDNAVASEWSQLCEQLYSESQKLQKKLGPVIEDKVSDVAQLLFQCDNCESLQSRKTSLTLFADELRHTAKKYLESSMNSNDDYDSEFLQTEAFSEHITAVSVSLVDKVVQDIDTCFDQIAGEKLVQENVDDHDLESERSSLLLQLSFLIAQAVLVQALSSFFSHDTSIKSTSVLSSLSQNEATTEKIATMLAAGAACRNNLASFLINNTGRGESLNAESSWQNHITSLASQLMDTDLEALKFQTRSIDYASIVAHEAITQAQLSFVIQKMKLQHKQVVEDLLLERESSKMVDAAEQEQHALVMETQFEEVSYQLDDAQKKLKESKELMCSMESDFQSELERKENSFRQEVQALKDGYEIRIRSLQADLDVGKSDLEKQQNERDHERRKFEESLQKSIIEFESEISMVKTEKESELLTSKKTIRSLEDILAQLRLQHRKELEEVNTGAVSNSSMPSENADPLQEQASKIEALKQQLLTEKTKHANELEQLQMAPAGEDNRAAQSLLTTKIQQLEEQIQNMQHDYEQELAIQKAAHRRELVRSKDEMMQLLSDAEKKSLYVDENSIRQKYNKEIDRIKGMYDRSFGALEKSHQKVIMQMRKAHKREQDRLRQEKDQVLAEETKATQAALDAMRKSHESELQKERNKFLDVIAKTYSQGDVESLQKQHESDLDLIQNELKSLSEHYSLRCIEKASLEERLDAQTKTLHMSRRRIQDLMASREELAARNKYEIEKLKRQVIKPSGPSSGNATEQELQAQMLIKDAELQQLQDEICALRDQQQNTKEEMEESRNKLLDLTDVHNVSEQRHGRELEELRHQLQEQSTFLHSEDESFNSSPDMEDDSEAVSVHNLAGLGSCHLFTSTPVKQEDHDNISDRKENHSSLLSEQKSLLAATDPQSSKKVLWRQRQPQRARSNPGLTGSISLALQKQLSLDHTTSPKPHVPGHSTRPRALRPRMSFDATSTAQSDEIL